MHLNVFILKLAEVVIFIKSRLINFLAFIFHEGCSAFEHWDNNQIDYAHLEAEKLCKGENLDLNDRIRLQLWIAPLIMPWFMLFRYGLWRDGIPGWAYILQRTCSEILIALALIERKFLQKNS